MTVNRSMRAPDVVRVDQDIHVDRTALIPAALRRVSWQAILSGVVVALVVQFALNLLGLAMGAAAFDPLYEQDPLGVELGAGTVVWMAASILISLFLGGLVAGRMAGMFDKLDGALHGVVVWAVVTLISILMLGNVAGNLVGSASSLLSGGLNLAGQGIATIVPEAAEVLELQNIRLQGIQDEARVLLNGGQDTVATTGTTTDDATSDGNATTTQPSLFMTEGSAQERELFVSISRLLRNPDDQTSRQAVADVLVTQGNVSEQEAQQTVDRWMQEYQVMATEAEETLRTIGQSVSDSIAVVAGVLFAILVVGAFSAGAGGIVGSPRDLPVVNLEDVEPAV